jgi:polysaccharide deacetylase family protein (PEP-CTERM system associated)
MRDGATKCIFTVDVEDWFHILDLPSAPHHSRWSELPSRVEANFFRLLEILGAADVRCTCFFLGWVAQRFPNLVKTASGLGHEIASHGYEHRLVYQMTARQFREDAMKARIILENQIGRPVAGFRAPGFSLTGQTPWFFDELLCAGYQYDSSLFPAARAHGGCRNSRREPHIVERPAGKIVEFPATVEDVAGKPLCFFGGGYLRLFPLPVIQGMVRRVVGHGRPVIFYVHPRDIDPAQPRMQMSPLRKFKCYVNLNTTQYKVEQLLREFSFTTMASMMHQMVAAPGPIGDPQRNIAAARSTPIQ